MIDAVGKKIRLGMGVAVIAALTATGAFGASNTRGASSDSTAKSASGSALGQPAGAISASEGHACAVTRAGAVKCWGSGVYGQLGNGSTTNPTLVPNSSLVPVPVRGLSAGVVAVSAGYYHTCALTRVGSVKCWGRSGDLGNGSTANSSVPVAVRGLSKGVIAISAGLYNTCAVTRAGVVKCWGGASRLPALVKGLARVSVINAGVSHTCAVTRRGAARCWGQNGSGQLGNGRPAPLSLVPVSVRGLSRGVAAIGAGTAYSCALTRAGAVKCWGTNIFGRLGNGSTANSPAPVAVSGLSSGVVAISVGNDHSCAVTRAGAAKCWGTNHEGQLGNNSFTDSSVPVDVSGLTSGVVAISAADLYTCALMRTGAVQCWGNFRLNGQRSLVPVPVPGLGP